jgi:hypothetical protein
MENYEEFLMNEEIFQFELDMEEGKYKFWIEKYPENVYGIFAAVLFFYGECLKEDDILFFITHGIDINKQSSCYKSDVNCNTPLTFACEYWNKNLVFLLLEAGANPNTPVIYGEPRTPLFCVLQGHSALCLHPSNSAKVLEIISLLQKFGLKPEGQIPKDFLEEFKKYECEDIISLIL